MLATFLVNIEVSIVGTSLITIANSLHRFSETSWIVTGYLVTYTGRYLTRQDSNHAHSFRRLHDHLVQAERRHRPQSDLYYNHGPICRLLGRLRCLANYIPAVRRCLFLCELI